MHLLSHKKFMELVKIVFSTPEGRELMGELITRYEDRISFRPGIDATEMAFMEGQRDVIATLRAIVKLNIKDFLATEDYLDE